MILRTYIDELRSEFGLKGITDFKHVDDRVLIAIINEQRATMLKNELNKGRPVEDSMLQTLDGVEVIPVTASTYKNFGSEDVILQTKIQIPKLIDVSYDSDVLNVRDSNMLSDKFTYSRYKNLPYVGHGRFTSQEIFYTLYKQYIYIKTTKNNPKWNMLSRITLDIVADDPTLVYQLQQDNGIYTDVRDMEYPLTKGLWTYIKGTILNLDVKPILEIKANEK